MPNFFLGLLGGNKEVEETVNRALRPEDFDSYIGQGDLTKKLKICIEAANEREEPVDHILLSGPPGLGKTTIAQIVAKTSGTKYKQIAAPALKNTVDILDILTKLEPRDILFLDEIHALSRSIEETIYSAMEDYAVSIKLGNKEITQISVNPFCLVGATTHPGKMSQPMRDRFGISYNMQFYSDEELAQIVAANIAKLDLRCESEQAILNIASRSRGTPRTANRLLRRVRDYAQLKNNNIVDNDVVNKALEIEGVDPQGLLDSDKKYISTIYRVYACGPVGVSAMAATMGEDPSTVSEFIEPFLVRKEYIARTKSGRVLTKKGMDAIRNWS